MSDDIEVDLVQHGNEKRIIWKNVTILSLCFMLLFTSFFAMANLQSTINSEEGLGNISQAVIYASLIVSSMFAPTLMIKKLGLKWTMVLCQFCYSTYIVAQFYPKFATLIPSAIVLGFGAGPLWTAQATYLTQMGIRHASLTGKKEMIEPSISRLFGFFFSIMGMAGIWGNLVGALVLSADSDSTSNSTTTPIRSTSHCGIKFCYEVMPQPSLNNLTNLAMPEEDNITSSDGHDDNINMLIGIVLGIAVLSAILLAIFLDNPSSEGSSRSVVSSKKMLVATFQHMKNPNQLLLIPITMWTGFEGTFWLTDFSFAFINCYLGVESICYVGMSLGAAMVMTSIACSYLIKRIGRLPFFLWAATIHLSVMATCQFLWNPSSERPDVFYIIAALWGTGSAIWITAINTLYGVMFAADKEAAFSNLRLWQSIGFAIALAYGSFLCVTTKLYILECVLTFGMIGYLIVELKERRRLKKEEENQVKNGIKSEDWSYNPVLLKDEDKSNPKTNF